jgi:hypothetical protein
MYVMPLMFVPYVLFSTWLEMIAGFRQKALENALGEDHQPPATTGL